MSTIWSAPVRYAEADQQGIVFNAHYLTYCDEAMTVFCRERGLLDLTENVHLVASALAWTAPARWGEVIEVDARCARLGTSSFVLHFDIRVGDRPCCTVDTTYVLTEDGRPVPLPASARAALSGG
ncbi:MAG: acyl-CoA thioesterase [Actinobacteria bacterium]|nr:acyl-CoA thioesterase [Actinomycetota bacterium]